MSRRGVKNGAYLEDSESETGRTGLSLTTWMTLVDPKDHILKVSGEYLNFQLSYSGLLIKLLTCERREEKREENQILVVALPTAKAGQKAAVGQGLPNKLINNIEFFLNKLKTYLQMIDYVHMHALIDKS